MSATERRVLVTGAGGLLGRYVVRELSEDWQVGGLDLLACDEGIHHTTGSIEDFSTVRAACEGCDAVVHVAARPNIWSGTGSEIVQTNLVGTWNVLEAAEQAGVQRVILTSSDSVLGFTVLEGAMIPPRYLPVDAAHPLNPTDPYALSKLLGERMGRAFVQRGSLEVLALRPVYVLYPEFECEVLARAADPDGYVGPAAGGRQPAGGGVMWQYVDPRDLARAYRLALEAPYDGFVAPVICAQSSLAPDPTVDRLNAYTGGTVEVRRPEVFERNPFAPIYDLTQARTTIGFLAGHDTRSRLGLDRPGGHATSTNDP